MSHILETNETEGVQLHTEFDLLKLPKDPLKAVAGSPKDLL